MKFNRNTRIEILTEKLHYWKWEACQKESPRKHKNIPNFDDVDGGFVRILRTMATNISDEIDKAYQQGKDDQLK